MNPQKLEPAITAFCSSALAELQARWNSWHLNLKQNEVHEVLGGLLARQVTLAIEIAQNPGIWNGHVAPVLLRTMVDTHITLAWVCGDPQERSRRFILFGLGQAKLDIEHRKAQLADGEPDQRSKDVVEALEDWVNSQRWTFLTDVDVGSWSGKSTREMAEEAGILDFYNYCYTPFSAATHSMWHHIAKYNLAHCESPLHRYHRLPVVPEVYMDPFYAVLAAKYLEKTFRKFDETFSISTSEANSYMVLQEQLQGIFRDEQSDGPEP